MTYDASVKAMRNALGFALAVLESAPLESPSDAYLAGYNRAIAEAKSAIASFDSGPPASITNQDSDLPTADDVRVILPRSEDTGDAVMREREECAKIADRIRDERHELAKSLDNLVLAHEGWAANDCAAAIRARKP